MQKLCQTCNSSTKIIFSLTYSGIGDSVFNDAFDFYHCEHCGLLFNGSISNEQVNKFYMSELYYFESPMYDFTIQGNQIRYEYYCKIIEQYIKPEIPMVDIACGNGAYIRWLYQKTGVKHKGIDIDALSLPNNNEGCIFTDGDAYNLPFEKNSQKALTYFHVLEHLLDVQTAIKGAYNVLEDGGLIFIDVPDATKYLCSYSKKLCDINAREHVMHYSPASLEILLNNNGFRVELIHQENLAYSFISNYSSLFIVARKLAPLKIVITADKGKIAADSKEIIQTYIKISEEIISIAKRYNRTVFWALSAHFFSVMPLCYKEINDIVICDKSKNKQQKRFYNSPIVDPTTIDTENSCLFICSDTYMESIREDALKIGFAEKDIYSLF